jgi:hypothetical protein
MKRILVALSLVLLVAPPTAALGQDAQDVIGVGISPGRVEIDLDGRRFNLSVTVTNFEDDSRRIFMSASALGHDLDGFPQFITPAPEVKALKISETQFDLGPDKSKTFRVDGVIPEGKRGLYAAVIAEFEPLDVPEDAPLQAKSRIASLFLLRAPKPWKQVAEVVDVGLLPGEKEKGPFPVFAAVENAGNVHFKPTGTVTATFEGEELATIELSGENIIPGFARRMLGSWDPPNDLTGLVQLEANVKAPGATGVGEVEFFEGTLSIPGARIVNLFARNRAGGPQVGFTLRNTGTRAFPPTVVLQAIDRTTDEERIVASETIELDETEPGEDVPVEWRPADLEPNTYLVRAQVSFEDRLLNENAVGLRIEGMGLLPWIAILLLALVIASYIWLTRRNKREGVFALEREARDQRRLEELERQRRELLEKRSG